jgi:AAHS family benzoate transporter-like MFS transporter
VGTTGTQILINTYVGTSYSTESRATALGLSLGVGRLGGVLGPTYGGYLLATGLPASGQFFAYAVPALFGCLVVLAIPGARRNRATTEAGTHA